MLQAIGQKLKRHFQRKVQQPLNVVSAQQMEAHSAVASLSVFSLLGHELHTPLNAIVGFTELLQQAERHGATQRQRLDYTSHILDSAQHLQNLLAQILDAGRASAGELSCAMQNFDLAEVLETTLRKLQGQAEAQDVTLNLHLDEGITVHGDIHRIGQACSALIENAIRFSEKGAEVKVRLLQSSDNGLIISVCDSGRGIGEDEASRLFNPFTQASVGFTRSHGGMGLGLYLTDAIAKLHGGSVELSARVPAGTDARIILPAHCITWPNQALKHHATA